MARPETAVVVISHYNAWPTDQLVKLLDQIQAIPAGYPFALRIVVNQARDGRLELPERHAQIPVYYRENVGYNIGAWDHGWRQDPAADYYLFLQEECVIARAGWLKAFVRAAKRPGVGVVGETIAYYNTSWDDLNESALLGDPEESACYFIPHIRNFGVDPGETADHLQSLVVCLRRSTLEAIGGLRLGRTKYEAIAAELSISKSVQAVGLKIRQVSLLPFRFIQHPQWETERREAQQPRRVLRRIVSDYLGLARHQRQKRAKSRQARGVPGFDAATLNPLNPRSPGSPTPFDRADLQ